MTDKNHVTIAVTLQTRIFEGLTQVADEHDMTVPELIRHSIHFAQQATHRRTMYSEAGVQCSFNYSFEQILEERREFINVELECQEPDPPMADYNPPAASSAAV